MLPVAVMVPVTDRLPDSAPPASDSLVESDTVIFAEPSKTTPLMFTALASFVAVAALPEVL